ncbi:MAG TPA: glycosyltransferase family 87 protein [Methylomirabilota bacterium]|nr:glycosyltransferase family 87 protein [Methylomirabilota bacterium]
MTVAGRSIWIIIAAAVGASLLLVVALVRWGAPSDEYAYWMAARRLIDGQPLYDPTVTIITPFAYLYPPPLAQALVPVALVVPSWLFSIGWTVLMGLALFWLAGRDPLRTLALIAFPPVAVEFWFRNVHLFLAVLVVLGLRHASSWFAVGAAIKISPGLGLPFLAVRGRWREAGIAAAIGLVMLVVSVALSPDAWRAYVDFILSADPLQQSSFVAVPLPIRAVAGLLLAIVAGRMRPHIGDPLLVMAVTLALPSLWFTGLSLLVGIVPLLVADRRVRSESATALATEPTSG